MKGGMRMLYRPAAVARHHHDITFSSFRRRQEKAGEAAAIFYEKHPELGDFLAVPLARTLRERAGPLDRLLPYWAALAERRELPGGRRAVDRVLRDDYLRGLREGLAGVRPDPFPDDAVTLREVRSARCHPGETAGNACSRRHFGATPMQTRWPPSCSIRMPEAGLDDSSNKSPRRLAGVSDRGGPRGLCRALAVRPAFRRRARRRRRKPRRRRRLARRRLARRPGQWLPRRRLAWRRLPRRRYYGGRGYYGRGYYPYYGWGWGGGWGWGLGWGWGYPGWGYGYAGLGLSRMGLRRLRYGVPAGPSPS